MHHHVLHGTRVVTEGRVDDPLERDVLALAIGEVRGDHDLRPARPDPIAERTRAEPGEDDRVDRSDPHDREHRGDGLDGRRHVDRHPVPAPDAERAERGRDGPDLVEQLPVREAAATTPFVGGDEGDLVAAAQRDLVIERGPRHVREAALEPAERGRLVDEDPVRRPEPRHELGGDLTPERLRIGQCRRPQPIERMPLRHRATVPDVPVIGGHERSATLGPR